MRHYKIACIVEGHGEAESVPELVDRWIRWRRFSNFSVCRPAVRTTGSGAFLAPYNPARQVGIEYYVEVALRNSPNAILVLRDADDFCLQVGADEPGLGPRLASRARAVHPAMPIGVVIANREFEAWALASLSRIRQAGLIESGRRLEEAHPMGQSGFRPILPERPRDCKGRIAELLGRSYSSAVDQRKLVREICFTPAACRRAPSLGKFLRELERLAIEARCFPARPGFRGG